jgi:hypothetical protein
MVQRRGGAPHVTSRQVIKSSQGKSSQVKSSQVQSSQVKSRSPAWPSTRKWSTSRQIRSSHVQKRPSQLESGYLRGRAVEEEGEH